MRPTHRTILAAVGFEHGIDVATLLAHDRWRHIMQARQIGMYLTRRLLALSYPDIGRRHGGRDHTTVIHATRTVEARIARDWHSALTVARCLRRIDQICANSDHLADLRAAHPAGAVGATGTELTVDTAAAVPAWFFFGALAERATANLDGAGAQRA